MLESYYMSMECDSENPVMPALHARNAGAGAAVRTRPSPRHGNSLVGEGAIQFGGSFSGFLWFLFGFGDTNNVKDKRTI